MAGMKLEQGFEQADGFVITFFSSQPLRGEIDRMAAKISSGSSENGGRLRLLLGGVAGGNPAQHSFRQSARFFKALMRAIQQIKGLQPQTAVSGGIEKLQQMGMRQEGLLLLQQCPGFQQDGGVMHAFAAAGGSHDGFQCLLSGRSLTVLQQGAGA